MGETTRGGTCTRVRIATMLALVGPVWPRSAAVTTGRPTRRPRPEGAGGSTTSAPAADGTDPSARSRHRAARATPGRDRRRASPTPRSRSATATTPATRRRPDSTTRCPTPIKAMIEWCNDQGGINGREVVGNYYDAKVLEVTNAMTQACNDKVFMLVGQGWCSTPARRRSASAASSRGPGFTVSAAFAHGPAWCSRSRTPATRSDLGGVPAREAVPGRGEEGGRSCTPNFPATIETTDKVGPATRRRAGVPDATRSYNIAGEADWKPFART